MDVTPNPPAKRARAKVTVKAAEKPRRTTLVAPRNKATTVALTIPAPKMPAATDLQGEIQTTAFYLAAERNFAPGHELDDWLEAERRIKALHSA